MAHAVETMVSGRGLTPWHRLGTVVEGAMTAEEALRLSGMDWDVDKRQDYFYNNDGQLTEAPGCFKLVRTDRNERNVLGSCKALYTPLQNREAFSFFDNVVSRKEAIYDTAGVLYEGRRVWILAKLPGEIRVNGNDISNKYVLITNGHDGTSSVFIKIVLCRVVCANTLAIALGEQGDTFKIRHTTSVHARVQDAARVMGFANQMYADLQEAFQAMASKRIGQDEADEYFEELVGSVPKRLAKVKELYEVGAGAAEARGTMWGAFNAVTEYVDHFAVYRGDNSKLNQIWYADANDLKLKAMDRALELV